MIQLGAPPMHRPSHAEAPVLATLTCQQAGFNLHTAADARPGQGHG